nr:DNA-(apurinic or apyrimidinic site) lyase [Ipomoea batatas]
MSSNNSGSVEWIPEVRCWCGEIAPVRMSWSSANPGKRFRACPHYGVRGNGNCRYFQWLDSDVSDRVAKVIRGLLKRLDKQDSEMQRLQAVIDEKNVNMKKKHLDSKFNFLYGFGIGIVVGFLCFMHWQRTVKSSANLFQLN